MLEACLKAGLVRLGHVALDSTKVPAKASGHKATSYGWMKRFAVAYGGPILTGTGHV